MKKNPSTRRLIALVTKNSKVRGKILEITDEQNGPFGRVRRAKKEAKHFYTKFKQNPKS